MIELRGELSVISLMDAIGGLLLQPVSEQKETHTTGEMILFSEILISG